MRTMDNKLKEKILNRLFDAVGICGFCHKRNCPHTGNRTLPPIIPVSVVLHAINLDEFYFNEEVLK